MNQTKYWFIIIVLGMLIATTGFHLPFQQDSSAVITSPVQGETVKGTVLIKGTASGPNFQYYKVEIAEGDAPTDDTWRLLNGKTFDQPILNDWLEGWDTTKYPDGVYSLRLRVVDNTGNYAEIIVPSITVQNNAPSNAGQESVPIMEPSQDGLLTPEPQSLETTVDLDLETVKIEGFGIGSSTHLRVGIGGLAEALDALQEMGVHWTREEIPWGEVEPKQDNFRWAYQFGTTPRDYDLLLTELSRRNIQMVALLDYGPGYISSPTPDELIARWKVYVQAVIDKFGDRIHYWEIGNEMNSPLFWGKVIHPGLPNQSAEPNPALYARMLRTAHEIIKRHDPKDIVVLGSLVGFVNGDCATNPFVYLGQLQAAGAWDAFDVIAFHPYKQDPPEAFTERGNPYDPVSGICQNGQTVRYNLISEIRAIRALAQVYGAKPIWITEIGWDQAWLEKLASYRDTEPDLVEADYVIRTYVPLLGEPGIEKVFWYTHYDDASIPGFHLGPTGQRALGIAAAFLIGSQPLGQFQGQDDQGQPGDDDVYEYRFVKDNRLIIAAWKARGGDVPRSVTITNLNVETIRMYDLDATDLSTEGGLILTVKDDAVTLSLTERPIFLVAEQLPMLNASEVTGFIYDIALPGETAELVFKVQNTGRVPWDGPGFVFVADTSNPANALESFPLSGQVQPGDIATWTVRMPVSGQLNVQPIRFQMHYNGEPFGSVVTGYVFVLPEQLKDIEDQIREQIDKWQREGEQAAEELVQQILELIQRELEKQVQSFIEKLLGQCSGTVAMTVLALVIGYRRSWKYQIVRFRPSRFKR